MPRSLKREEESEDRKRREKVQGVNEIEGMRKMEDEKKIRLRKEETNKEKIIQVHLRLCLGVILGAHTLALSSRPYIKTPYKYSSRPYIRTPNKYSSLAYPEF